MITSSTNRDRGSSEALLTEEEFAARLSAPDPRMAGLSVSNDALRNSLPVAPPWSLRKWVDANTGGSLRKLEHLQLSGVDWLVARKPWQRWTLSLGFGAMIGLGIVFSGAKFFRGGLQSASAVASALPTAEVVAAVRPALSSAAGAAAPGTQLPRPEPVAAPAVEAPVVTAVAGTAVVAEEAPAAAPEPAEDDSSADAAPEKPGKHKKKGKRSRSRHQKAQSESSPLKQAAAAAAFKLAQPTTSRSKRSKHTKATASF
jgi:hypothetical protein